MEGKELKTKVSTRIIIAAIGVVLLGSTIAMYMGMVLGYNSTQAESEVKEARFQQLYMEWEAERAKLAGELSNQYFSVFGPWRSEVKSFNNEAVTDLSVRDLVVGTGREIVELDPDMSWTAADGGPNMNKRVDTEYAAYYIGWIADGTIFDSTLNSTTSPTGLTMPLAGGTFIEGWNRGIIGMRIGGIREITIPAKWAYADQGAGEHIAPGASIKFVIMLIDPVDDPEAPDEMWELYYELYGFGY